MKKLLLICSIACLGLLNACNESKIEPIPANQSKSLKLLSLSDTLGLPTDGATSSSPELLPTDSATAMTIIYSVVKEYPDARSFYFSSIVDKKIIGLDTYTKDIRTKPILTEYNNSAEAVASSSGKILSLFSYSGTNLSNGIKTYLETTYPGNGIQQVSTGYAIQQLATGTTTRNLVKVVISLNNQKIMTVFDDRSSVVTTFKEPTNTIGGDKNKIYFAQLTDLPTSIQSQLTGNDFVEAIVKVNSNNSQKMYSVSVKKDGILRKLTFNNNGVLIV